jgi:hypothetical protein
MNSWRKKSHFVELAISNNAAPVSDVFRFLAASSKLGDADLVRVPRDVLVGELGDRADSFSGDWGQEVVILSYRTKADMAAYQIMRECDKLMEAYPGFVVGHCVHDEWGDTTLPTQLGSFTAPREKSIKPGYF